MPKPVTSDTEARRLALDVERSWVVEAPAGSGKTGLLIQRYLCLLAHASVTEPEQVLAITFTRAATEEIRERLLRALQRADEAGEPHSDYDRETIVLAAAVLQRDRHFGWRLLEEPHRLRVRTIDAVCAEISHSLPILSGSNGSLKPVEDASFLYREASQRTWLCLGGPDKALSEALRIVLLHRDGDLHACEALVAEMLSERDQWGSLVPLRAEDLTDEALDVCAKEQLNLSLEFVICEFLGRLTKKFPEQALNRLASLAKALGSRSGHNDQVSPIAICRNLHRSPADAREDLSHWRALAHLLIAPSTGKWRSGFNSNHVQFTTERRDRIQLKELVSELQDQPDLLELLNELGSLPPQEFPEEQWEVTKALFQILRRALAELQLVFHARNRCDFAEPALLARYALDRMGGGEHLEDALGTELKHMLVDEMQDTSTRQYELIQRLTGGWAHEGKTIFLVGDPKQSIYLFRQARVERFVETMRTQRLGDLPVGLLQLSANFRSQANLVRDFNRDFTSIFASHRDGPEDVGYLPAVATRDPSPRSGGSRWNLSVSTDDSTESRKVLLQQGRWNALRIRKLIEELRQTQHPSGRPWKIAILVPSRVSLVRILPELQKDENLPVRALKIDRLEQRREIQDLLALCRALLHPGDRTAWLAVLHAPWCGLGLADLHALVGQDNERFLRRSVMELVEELGAEISLDGIARLERAWPVLSSATKAITQVRFPELLEETWRALGGDAALDDVAFNNANSFFALLRSLDLDEGEVILSHLEQHVSRLYAAPNLAEDAVEIATIHGAKGLEWDVVIVPELQRQAPVRRSRLLAWEELPSGGIVLAPIPGKGEEAQALNHYISRVRDKREAAERRRLFYVASTRAREELHLFGVAQQRRDGRITPPRGSLLEAAWPAAEARLPETSMRMNPDPIPSVDLAAVGEEIQTVEPHRPILERVPLDSAILANITRSDFDVAPNKTPHMPTVTQAPGSFLSRCLGLTLHSFLEELSIRLSAGEQAPTLQQAIPSWESRIRAVLRSYGLPPSGLATQARVVLTALSRTLSDATGRWILEGKSEARNELALTTWQDQHRHYRLDRIFRAGFEPRASGDQYLWIIDYKSAFDRVVGQHEASTQAFLACERKRYQPQMERYARLMGEHDIRLGLWFPLMARLEWWTATDLKSDEKLQTPVAGSEDDRSAI